MLNIINIPTIPVAFFIILLYPIIVSIASPNMLPTTGTDAEITDLLAFLVILSTLLVSPPSNEASPIKIPKTVVKIHTELLLRNFDNLSTRT